MAAQLGGIYVSLTMDARPYASAWGRAEQVTSSATQKINRDVGLSQRSINSFTTGVGNKSFRPYALLAASRGFETAADRAGLLRGALLSLTAVAGGFTAALSTNVIARYADTFVNLQNQLRTVTTGTANLLAVQDALSDVSERSRSSLQATATFYARTARASEHLGLSQEKLLQITETVQKAFSIGGATSAEAQGAAIQLSQGIASDRFSGEEFRSVAENAPVLLRGMADALGVTIGKLREMAHAGELTGEVVTTAILKSSSAIEAEFGLTVVSVDRALTQVDNRILEYIGKTDQAFGATKLISSGILAFGDNLETLVPILTTVSGLIGASFLGRSKGALGGTFGALLGGIAGNALGGAQGGILGALLGGGLGFLGGKGKTIEETGPDGQTQQRQVGFFKAIKHSAEEAKERVAELTRQQALLRKEMQISSIEASRARRAGEGDTFQLAPSSLTSAFKRDLVEVQKLDKQRLDLNEKIAGSYRKLAEISSTMSARAITLADNQVKAEQKLSESLRQQESLRVQRVQAITKETAALGMQVGMSQKMAATTAALKERVGVEKDLAKVQTTIAKDTEALAQRSVALSTLKSEADSKAAKQRIALTRQINAQLAEGNNLDQARLQQTVQLAGARNAAEREGAAIAKETANIAAASAKASGAAWVGVTAQLGAATKAATPLGQAFGFLRAQGASLVGLFGGPWGVAITGAIAILGALGIKAQEEAQRIANARKLISDELNRMGQDPGGTNQAEVQPSIAAKEAENTVQNIKDVEAQIAKARQGMKDLFLAPISGRGGTTAVFVAQRKEMELLTEQYIAGSIGLEAYDAGMTRLETSASSPLLQQLGASFRAGALDIRNGEIALEGYRGELKELYAAASDPALKALLGSFDQLNDQKVDFGLTNALKDVAALKAFDDAQQKNLRTLEVSAITRREVAAAQEYLNAAEDAGNDVTSPAVIAKAEAYGKQKVALEDAAAAAQKYATAISEMQDQLLRLEFDRAISGLTTFQQKVAGIAYDSGIAVPAIQAFLGKVSSFDFSFSGLSSFAEQFQRIIELVRRTEELEKGTASALEFAEGIKSMNEEIADLEFEQMAKGLDPFNKKVVEAAHEMGISNEEISEFISQLKNIPTSGLDGVSAKFKEIIALVTKLIGLQSKVGQNVTVPKADGSGTSTVIVNRPTAPAGGSGGGGGLDTNDPGYVNPGPRDITIPRKASGGPINGPGTGTSDDVLMWGSNGEFVVRAAQARKYRSLLEAINDNDLPAFASGGGVGMMKMPKKEKPVPDDLMGSIIRRTVNKKAAKSATPSGRGGAYAPKTTESPDSYAAFREKNKKFLGDYARLALMTGNLNVTETFGPAFEEATAYAYAATRGLRGSMMNNPNFSFEEAWARPGLKDGGFVGKVPGFKKGGAIMGGPDSQMVSFRKSPEESVGIFTPKQMNIVRDAVNSNRENGMQGGGGNNIDVGGIHVPVTSSADPQEIARVVEARMADFLTKWANGRVG